MRCSYVLQVSRPAWRRVCLAVARCYCTMADVQRPQFYRRTLPDSCISFNSPEGKRIFQEALAQGHMECYFGLASQFRTQDEPAYCGISTIVMVLNTLEVDPGRVWKGVWRWYHEDMMDCCMPLERIRDTGINLEQFACLASCNTLDVSVTRPEQSSEEDFRNTVKRLTAQEHEIMVATYSRGVMNQTGSGHFSPIGGYHPKRDLVLMLDTARFKYPPHWVSLSLLWEAMKELDPDTGLSRGLVTLKKSGLYPLVLFRLSDLWSVNVKDASVEQSQRVQAFVDEWTGWLKEQSSGSTEPAELLTAAIETLLNALEHFNVDEYILSTHVNVKCAAGLSKEHACVLCDMITGLTTTGVYQAVHTHLEQFNEVPDAVRKAGLGVGQARCGNDESGRLCKRTMKLSVHHFLSMLLLMWPYEAAPGSSRGTALGGLVKRELPQLPVTLQNEVAHLHNQLQHMMGLVSYEHGCQKDTCSQGSCTKAGVESQM